MSSLIPKLYMLNNDYDFFHSPQNFLNFSFSICAVSITFYVISEIQPKLNFKICLLKPCPLILKQLPVQCCAKISDNQRTEKKWSTPFMISLVESNPIVFIPWSLKMRSTASWVFGLPLQLDNYCFSSHNFLINCQLIKLLDSEQSFRVIYT